MDAAAGKRSCIGYTLLLLVVSNAQPFKVELLCHVRDLTAQAGSDAMSLGALLKSVGIGRVSVDVGMPKARSDSTLRIDGVLFEMPIDPHLLTMNGNNSALLQSCFQSKDNLTHTLKI